MRKRSETFELWLLAGGIVLVFVSKTIFEGLFYSALLKFFERHLGITEAEVVTRFADISVALLVGIGTVWLLKRRIELNQRDLKQELLDDISELRERLVRLRIDMQADHMCLRGKDYWEAEFKALEKRIAEKIEAHSSRAEASIYSRRGNITRQVVAVLPHSRIIDICVHDLDHLKDYITRYSGTKS